MKYVQARRQKISMRIFLFHRSWRNRGVRSACAFKSVDQVGEFPCATDHGGNRGGDPACGSRGHSRPFRGHESGLLAGASQVDLLEEMGVEGRSLAGANPDFATVDRQAPQCDEEAGRGRRMGSVENVRYWSVGREAATRKRARRSTGCTSVRYGGKSETKSQRLWKNGSKEQKCRLEMWSRWVWPRDTEDIAEAHVTKHVEIPQMRSFDEVVDVPNANHPDTAEDD